VSRSPEQSEGGSGMKNLKMLLEQCEGFFACGSEMTEGETIKQLLVIAQLLK